MVTYSNADSRGTVSSSDERKNEKSALFAKYHTFQQPDFIHDEHTT
jgi:hypothetical protein